MLRKTMLDDIESVNRQRNVDNETKLRRINDIKVLYEIRLIINKKF